MKLAQFRREARKMMKKPRARRNSYDEPVRIWAKDRMRASAPWDVCWSRLGYSVEAFPVGSPAVAIGVDRWRHEWHGTIEPRYA